MTLKTIAILTSMLALASCQSASKKAIEPAPEKQAQVETLERHQQILMDEYERVEREKAKLQETINELNAQLEQEVAQQQVCIEQSKKAGEIKLTMQQDILFDSSSYALSAAGSAMLKKVVAGLKEQDSQHRIRIVGHTDNMPVMEKWHLQFIDNWDLSARRAAAVARQLIWGEGFAPEAITVSGRAFVEPIASNATPEGQAKNRRIELLIQHLDL